MDPCPGASDSDMTAKRVAERLGLGDSQKEWLRKLESATARSRLAAPDSDRLMDLLGRLEVPFEDRAEVLETIPRADRDPEMCWLLERSYQMLAQGMVDRVRQTGPPPPVP